MIDRIEKILFIFMGGVGEMILSTPALKALWNAFPKSYIGLLSRESPPVGVIQNSRFVDEIFFLKKGILENLALIHKIRKKHFDLAITATGVNPIKAGLFALLIGAKFRVGENINGRGIFYNIKLPFDKETHEVESNLNIIRNLGINAADKELYIYSDEEDREFANNFLVQYGVKTGDLVVGIHPGSGKYQARFRRWSPTRFAKVGDKIVDNYNAKIILLGGKEEIGVTNKVAALMNHKPIIASGKTTLGQLAALIKNFNLVVSNDSGIVHIACAVKTPVIAIFGPANYKKTGPWSRKAVIVRKDLPCSPCYSIKGTVTRKTLKCKELLCLKEITVDDVFSKVKGWL